MAIGSLIKIKQLLDIFNENTTDQICADFHKSYQLHIQVKHQNLYFRCILSINLVLRISKITIVLSPAYLQDI